MILLIDCGSSKTPYISDVVDEFMDVKTIGIEDLKKADFETCKGVIISGAPILVTEVDVDPYMNQLDPLRTFDKPILGICFGHQIIGLMSGAFASKMKEDRDWQTIEVYENCPLFDKLPIEVQMMEDHCETISIPAGFKLIASSDACINEAMQHHTKLIFGVQFHPEVSGNHGRVLIENFIRLTQ